MNILIIPDKFKGSLSALEVSETISQGVREAFVSINRENPDNPKLQANIIKMQMADGGDGSLDVVERYFGGERERIVSYDPLGREIEVDYLLKAAESTKTAFIEMAKVSGLELLKNGERDPLKTSTYGLGVVIKDAIDKGAEEIFLSIGGSATNDCGVGMLQALGAEFLFNEKIYSEQLFNKAITGEMLGSIESVSFGKMNSYLKGKVKFKVICDVDNPLYGEYGATNVYGLQKGADEDALKVLECGVRRFSDLTDDIHKTASNMPGSGAAGGVGYAMAGLLNAEMISGSSFFAHVLDLESKVKWADLVISGEGRVDEQSFFGKVVGCVYGLCKKHGKPLLLFCGDSLIDYKLYKQISIATTSSIAQNFNDSICNAQKYLFKLSSNPVLYSEVINKCC